MRCSSRFPKRPPREVAPTLLDAGLRVIDLSGAFRLRDDATRARWYPDHGPAAGGRGLRPDRVRARRHPDARLLSNPGCYPTASLLGLLPLQRAGLLQPGADM